MTSPLARPPIGTPLSEPLEEAPCPRTASTIARVLAEVCTGIADADGRRLAWRTAAALPDFTFPGIRARMLAAVGCDLRRGVGVLGYVHLIGPSGSAKNLRVGAGSLIGPGAAFCLDAPITIGENVSIGPKAMLYTAMHLIGGPSRRMHPSAYARPIVIEDGAWIALGALILPGVRVGRGAVVAAGAVVSKDVPDNVLVAGNPAAVVQELPDPGHLADPSIQIGGLRERRRSSAVSSPIRGKPQSRAAVMRSLDSRDERR